MMSMGKKELWQLWLNSKAVIHLAKGRWFLQSICQSIVGQDTEPHIAPDAVPSVCACEW